uniref:Uncharacterized protein n=1 Tax=Setaria viridis TaxID=4556 RepID=A0A4U6VGE1_SETVI|nr:hypothetical protein SEVIR_3G276900v2 [Setaria viridis]
MKMNMKRFYTARARARRAPLATRHVDAAHWHSASTRSPAAAGRRLTRPAATPPRSTLSARAPAATCPTPPQPRRLEHPPRQPNALAKPFLTRTLISPKPVTSPATPHRSPLLSANGTATINGCNSAPAPLRSPAASPSPASFAAPPRPYKWRPGATCAPFPRSPNLTALPCSVSRPPPSHLSVEPPPSQLSAPRHHHR